MERVEAQHKSIPIGIWCIAVIISYGINGKYYKQLKRVAMRKNMSSADRIIRLIISAIMVTLYFTEVVGGTIGIILIVLSSVFTLTSFIGFCPLYAVFGFSTCPVKKH